MKIYLAIKYHSDHGNRALIEELAAHLSARGHSVACVVRDVEEWGRRSFDAAELMRRSFALIRESDLLLVELSEKGVGLGIEAGYAHALGIPVVTVAREGADVSNTLAGISREVVRYARIPDIAL